MFEVADGFFSADFQGGRGNEKGTAPDLYISKTALEGLTSQIKIFRIAFDTDGKHDDEVFNATSNDCFFEFGYSNNI